MKTIVLMLILGLSIRSYGKEIKHEVDMHDDTVYVDGKSEFILAKMKMGLGTYNFFLKDLQGKKLAFLQINSFKDPKEVSRYNPEGTISYFEVTFLESNAKAEIPHFLKQGKIAEFLVKQELVKDGKISEDAEQEFILVNGSPYSLKRQELNGGTIIINNNNTTPQQGNGVNFHIGN